MAVIDELEEEDEQDGGGTQTSSAPSAIGQNTEPSDQQGTSSGSYTNLQKYIEANSGRDFGGQVAGKIDEGTNKGLSDLGAREGEFRSAVDENTLDLDEGLKQRISDAPQGLSSEDKTLATNIRTKSYAGPTDFGGGIDDPYADLRKHFGGLEEQKKVIGDTTGSRKALIKQMYNRPTYTEGEQELDTLILSGQREPVNAARDRLGSAIDTYGQKKGELNAYGSAASEKSKKAKQDYSSLLGLDETGTVGEFKRGSGQEGLIQKDLERLYKKADDKNAGISSESARLRGAGLDLTNPNMGIYQNLGGADRSYGINPADYLSMASDVNYKTTANQDDLARMQALTDLAGVDQTYLDQGMVGRYDDESGMSFDVNKYLEAVNSQKAQLDNTLRTTNYSPFNADPWAAASGSFGNLLEGQQEGEVSDPQLQLEAMIASGGSSPQDLAIRQRQLDEIKNRRAGIQNQYGYNQLIRR